MFNKLIIILSPFFFVSCVSLSTIEIQVLEPASDPLVPYIRNTILLNRTIINEAEQENSANSFFPHNDVELFNKASTEIIFSLADILNESPGMEFTDERRLLEVSKDEIVKNPEHLESEFVLFICDSLDADGILSLEYLKMELPDRIELTQRNNQIYNVNYYQGKIALGISALWLAYQCDGRVKDKYLWIDTLVWRHASFIANEIPDYLPGPEDATMEAAYYTALTYARRISPYWTVKGRNYFSRGNRKLRLASNYINNDQFDKAEILYKSLQENRNINVAAAASFNLAFINEIKGDYRQSLKWIRISYKYRRHPATIDYLDILEERFKKSRELDRQLGKEN